MVDRKITGFDPITSTGLDDADVIPVSDVSAGSTAAGNKKVTILELRKNMVGDIPTDIETLQGSVLSLDEKINTEIDDRTDAVSSEASARATADAALLDLASAGDQVRLSYVSGDGQDAVYGVVAAQAALALGAGQLIQFAWPGANTGVGPTLTIGATAYVLRASDGSDLAVADLRAASYVARIHAGSVIRVLSLTRVADVPGLGGKLDELTNLVSDEEDRARASEALGDTIRLTGATGTGDVFTANIPADQATIPMAVGQPVYFSPPSQNMAVDPKMTVDGVQYTLKTRAGGDIPVAGVQAGRRYLGIVWSLSPNVIRIMDVITVAQLAETDTAKIMTAAERAAIQQNTQDISTAAFERAIMKAVEQVLGKVRVFPMGDNSMGLAHAVADQNNRVLFGQKPSGTTYEGAFVRENLGENNMDLLSATVDSDGVLLHGVRRSGGFFASGLVHDPLYDNNLDLVGDVIVDADDRVIFGVRADGTILSYVVTVNTRWEMFTLTGQSLAEGGANPAITTTPPYDKEIAAKFANGPVGKQTEVIGPGLVALAEQTNETICTGMARRIQADHPEIRLLMNGQAWGGKTIDEISPGAPDGVYEKIQDQLDLAGALAPGAVVRAVGQINGEADGLISTVGFELKQENWRRQFALDLAERLGQSEVPYLMTCQTSSVAGYRGGSIALRDSFTTPFAQLRGALTNPYYKLVGPKYHLSYVDHSHIDGLSTRLWGEKYGQVWRQLFVAKMDWMPVHATSVLRDNDAIVIDLHSPVGMPIEIDNISVTDPGDLGFNLLDAAGVVIGSVTQTGDYQVTVECSGNVPDGSRLSYAFHNGIAGTSGWNTGARGCVRDSDMTRSVYTGNAMPNWLCAFQTNF